MKYTTFQPIILPENVVIAKCGKWEMRKVDIKHFLVRKKDIYSISFFNYICYHYLNTPPPLYYLPSNTFMSAFLLSYFLLSTFYFPSMALDDS